MDQELKLPVPTVQEMEREQLPAIEPFIEVIGALLGAGGLVSPKKLDLAMAASEEIGSILGNSNLARALVLRALSSPKSARTAVQALKVAANSLSATQRSAIMREMGKCLTDPQSYPIDPQDIANALTVPLPDQFKKSSDGVMGTLSSAASKVRGWVRSQDNIVPLAKEFALELDEAALMKFLQETKGVTVEQVRSVLLVAVDSVRTKLADIARAEEKYREAVSAATELDKVSDQIERVASQRYAAIVRRAKLLKRHLRDELIELVENASEEFEADFRRLSDAQKGWFGGQQTTEFNERQVIKNLDRRYQALARRYQDQLAGCGNSLHKSSAI